MFAMCSSSGEMEELEAVGAVCVWNWYLVPLGAFAMITKNSQMQVAYTSHHSFLHNAIGEQWIGYSSAPGWGQTLGRLLASSRSETQASGAFPTCNMQPCGRHSRSVRGWATPCNLTSLLLRDGYVMLTCISLAKASHTAKAKRMC